MQRAFSLIELSITLVIVSLMVGFGLKALEVSAPADCYATTRAQLTSIRTAMDRFVASNSRYPLPAGRSLNLADPQNGREAASAGSSAIDRLANSNPLLFGALPYQALGLPASFSSDCWGNKFTYAVSENFTDSSSYNDPATVGGITIKSGNTASNSTVSSSTVFVVFSHGQNGVGASKRDYSGSKLNCNGTTGTAVDKENCDITDAIFFTADFANGRDAADYFDDVIIYGGKKATLASNGVWKQVHSFGDGSTFISTWGLTHHIDCIGGVGSPPDTNDLITGASCYPSTNYVCEDVFKYNDNVYRCANPVAGAACPVSVVRWAQPGDASGGAGPTESGYPCTGTTTAMTSGQTISVSNTAPSHSGSSSVTCTDGILSTSSSTCN